MKNMNPIHLERAIYYADKAANKMYSQLPGSERVIFEKEDIKQDMLVCVFENYVRYDKERKFDNWVCKVLRNWRVSAINSVWNKVTKEFGFDDVAVGFEEEVDFRGSMQYADSVTVGGVYFRKIKNDVEFDVVLMDEESPEFVCIEEETEMERLVIVSKTIKDLCKSVGVEFIFGEEADCLVKVLDRSLNGMTDEEFNSLPYKIQVKLVKLGEAMERSCLKISGSGKLRSVGVVKAVRELIRKGVVNVRDVKRELDKMGVVYQANSLSVILCQERKLAGVKSDGYGRGIDKRVRELFDYGKGILTAAEMIAALKKEGYRCTQGTVREYVARLRREFIKK